MADKKQDVKPNPEASSASSTATSKPDVKNIDEEAERLIGEVATESSTEAEEEEESAVLEENETPEKKKESEEEAETEEAEAESPEGEAEDEEEEGEEESKTEEGTTEHEKAIPYERFKEVNDKLTTIQPMADAQQRLTQFCQSANISVEQFQQAMEMLRLENANPAEALRQYESKLESLRVATGTGLPADLQNELAEGTISEARAKEIAKLRLQTAQAQRQAQADSFSAQQRQHQAAVQTLETWARSKQKLDPSFKPKAGLNAVDGRWEDFLDKFARLNIENQPQDVRGFVANAEAAYDMLVKRAVALVKPKARKVITSTGASHRSSEPEKPKSMDEAAAIVARKHGYSV